MNPIWSWVLTLMGVTCFFLAGRKIWWAWYVGLATQVVWVAYSVATQQWGFLAGCALYTWVYTKNARLWTREHKAAQDFAGVETVSVLEAEPDDLPEPITENVPPFIYRGIYRRRALVAEARRWDGSYAVAQEIVTWVQDNGGRATYQEAVVPPQTNSVVPSVAVPAHLWIHIEEGALEILAGDYVVAEPWPRPGREFDRLTPEEVEDNLELLEILDPVDVA